MLNVRWLFCFCLVAMVNFIGAQSINYSPITIVAGCPVTFTDTAAGTQYIWNFGPFAGASATDTTTNPSSSNYFTKAGTYWVKAAVTTNCCGMVMDSVMITVGPNPLNISLNIRPNVPVCPGTEMTFNATTSTYQSYSFFIDDSLIQHSATDSMNTWALFTGDSVSLIAYNGACYTNAVVVHPIIKPIPTAPLLTSTNTTDSSCGGDTVTYTATPGYDNYVFSDGASIQESGPSNTWVNNSLEQGNSISVKGYMSGCESLISNIISIIIKPSPLAILGMYPNPICHNSVISDTIMAAPQPGSSYFFYINNELAQGGYNQVYFADSLHVGDTISLVCIDDGCPSILASTTVTKIAPESYLSFYPWPECGLSSAHDTIIATSNVQGTYFFYLDSILVQSGNNPVYIAPSLLNGATIKVVEQSSGCPSDSSLATINTSVPGYFYLSSYPTCLVGITPDTITLVTGLSGVSYFFYLNHNLVQSGPDSIYVADSLQYGEVIAVIAQYAGCPSYDDSLIFGDNCTGIATVSANSLQLYPNPVTNQLTVSLISPATADFTATIFDLTGRIVKADYTKEPNKFVFNTTALATGAYFVQINSGEQIITAKFIKQE